MIFSRWSLKQGKKSMILANSQSRRSPYPGCVFHIGQWLLTNLLSYKERFTSKFSHYEWLSWRFVLGKVMWCCHWWSYNLADKAVYNINNMYVFCLDAYWLRFWKFSLCLGKVERKEINNFWFMFELLFLMSKWAVGFCWWAWYPFPRDKC